MADKELVDIDSFTAMGGKARLVHAEPVGMVVGRLWPSTIFSHRNMVLLLTMVRDGRRVREHQSDTGWVRKKSTPAVTVGRSVGAGAIRLLLYSAQA